MWLDWNNVIWMSAVHWNLQRRKHLCLPVDFVLRNDHWTRPNIFLQLKAKYVSTCVFKVTVAATKYKAVNQLVRSGLSSLPRSWSTYYITGTRRSSRCPNRVCRSCFKPSCSCGWREGVWGGHQARHPNALCPTIHPSSTIQLIFYLMMRISIFIACSPSILISNNINIV